MELILLKLVAFFRPLASIKYAADVFEIVGVGLFGLIVLVFLSNSALRKTITVSAVDVVIVSFALWCIAIYIIYFDKARISEVAKMLIPLLSYIVVKNVVRERAQYTRLLFWMIIGFSVPLMVSVFLIATGQGLDYVSYWTGIPRWEGAYTGAHSLGHSMTLFLITLVLYSRLTRQSDEGGTVRKGAASRVVFAALGALAVFLLYKSQVRSAIVGLIAFAAVYLSFYNRKLLLAGGAGLAVLAVATLPVWMPVLLPDVWLVEQGRADVSAIGSGRQTFWRHNLELFADLPFDRQLAGVGIGNRDSFSAEDVLDSHNDWLDVLMQTGIVGVLLLLGLQILVLRAILRIPGRERFGYLALFIAVNIMMFVSNSYVWRIQVSHLYFMMLAYIEVKRDPRTEAQQAEAIRHGDVIKVPGAYGRSGG
jgi:O-antigen ligase